MFFKRGNGATTSLARRRGRAVGTDLRRQFRLVGHRVLALVVLAMGCGHAAQVLYDRLQGLELGRQVGADVLRKIALQKACTVSDWRLSMLTASVRLRERGI